MFKLLDGSRKNMQNSFHKLAFIYEIQHHLTREDSSTILLLCPTLVFFLWPAAAGKQPARKATSLSPTSSAESSSHHGIGEPATL